MSGSWLRGEKGGYYHRCAVRHRDYFETVDSEFGARGLSREESLRLSRHATLDGS